MQEQCREREWQVILSLLNLWFHSIGDLGEFLACIAIIYLKNSEKKILIGVL